MEESSAVISVRRRIEQLLNGKFEYETAKLKIVPEKLELAVKQGQTVSGSFCLSSSSGNKVRGFIYSSSARMVFEPIEFQGVTNEIRYQMDVNGMEQGAREEGIFTICTELGEYTLPYTVSVTDSGTGEKAQASMDLQGLAELARTDFQKAYRVFISDEFGRYLRNIDHRLSGLYDALMKTSVSYESLESFLVGTGAKEPVKIVFDDAPVSSADLREPVQEKIRFTRNGWGFGKLQISSDADFIRLDRNVVTTDEFAGSTYELNYILDPGRMHAGNNYGRIRIDMGFEVRTVEVTARKAEGSSDVQQRLICRRMQKKLEELYIAFRLKKIDVDTWVQRSQTAISNYRSAGGKDPFAELFQVQLYYADNKHQKAIRLLNELRDSRSRLVTVEQYGFYLYLTTFFRQETEYVDQIEAEIEEMFAKHPSSWVLQWILMYLKESLLNDPAAKYEAVRDQFEYGCRSRIMYLEAFQILKQDPLLLRKPGDFELQLLRFGAKEHVLTAEIMRQVSGLAMHDGEYQEKLFRILTAGYEADPAVEMVRAICSYLMKGNKKGAEYFSWYEKGVECGLRITGLYEYYMESMECIDFEKLPQIIRMYFTYDSSLDYRKRAAIYRNILEQKENAPQTWRSHRAAMQKFAQEQLEAGHFSEDLAVLYRELLRKDALNRTTLEKLAQFLFTYQVKCPESRMKYAIVHSPYLTQEQIVPFADGTAQIQIYEEDSWILVEDQEGSRFPALLCCEMERLMEEERLLTWCLEGQPEIPGLLMHLCCESLKAAETEERMVPCLRAASKCDYLTEEFRDATRAKLLSYYLSHALDETLPGFLKEISFLDYVKVDKASLVTLLAEEGMCEEAFELLDRYGAEGIPLIRLVRICSRMVLAYEFGENRMLLSLCHYCFASGKYDDKLLRYLLLYYEGPIQDMIQIWQAGMDFELDTMLLEEKIMMMLLFTRTRTEGTEPIFESYRKKMGRKKLCRAYVNLKAYEYFVKGMPVGRAVFAYIEREYGRFFQQGRLQEQEDVCRLALMQYYANAPELSEKQERFVRQLLEEYDAKGMRFAFWQKFEPKLLAPYQMDGRVFAEYVGNPRSKVTIYYKKKGVSAHRPETGELPDESGQILPADPGDERNRELPYNKEVVKNCFEGIFVREFTLFSGEELECYLEESIRGETKRSGLRVLKAEESKAAGTTQYDLLNRMTKAEALGDREALKEELETFLLQEYLAKELFTLI